MDPLKTVVSYRPNDNEATATGWTKLAVPNIWAKAINEYVEVNDKVDFNTNGRERVRRLFSRNTMSDNFEETIERMIWKKKTTYPWETALNSTYYFGLYLLSAYFFPGQYLPCIFLAVYAAAIKRSYFWMCYYLFMAFLLTS